MWVPVFVFILSFMFSYVDYEHLYVHLPNSHGIKEMNSLIYIMIHDSISPSITSEEITVCKVERTCPFCINRYTLTPWLTGLLVGRSCVNHKLCQLT